MEKRGVTTYNAGPKTAENNGDKQNFIDSLANRVKHTPKKDVKKNTYGK